MSTDDLMVMDKSDGVMRIRSRSNLMVNKSYSENGYLVFDEMLLADILNSLRINYDVTFTVTDKSILDDRYRGIFLKSEQPIEDILATLALASNGRLHYKVNGKDIILY